MDDGPMDLQKSETTGSDKMKSTMADSNNCVQCGRTSDLVCKKCKTEVYCSPECQLQHWKVHKPQCTRNELNGSACDACGDTEKRIACCCCECGFLFCESCSDHIYNPNGGVLDESLDFVPCPGCEKNMKVRQEFYREHLLKLIKKSTDDHRLAKGLDYPEGIEKLLELVKESPDGPRLAQWLILLGCSFKISGSEDWEKNAIQYLKQAGKLGLGEGYCHLAEIYIDKQNWKEAKRYYRKAADLHDVHAIYMIGTEAHNGFIDPQQEREREPDPKEAFRWFQIGAQLCDPACCLDLGGCYSEGIGTTQNLVKAFKWAKTAAEMGSAAGMRQYGECYRLGKGVEQSNEQAIYWFKKSLEQEDDAETRSILHNLYNL